MFRKKGSAFAYLLKVIVMRITRVATEVNM